MIKIQKILVRAPNWIGDAVMATPSLSALRRRFHEAEIVLLAKPVIAAVFEQHPDIDRIILYEDPGKHHGIFGLWRLSRLLKTEQFNMALLLQNAFEAALLAFFAGIPQRLGYATDGRRLFLTQSLNKKEAPIHRSDAYFSLLQLIANVSSGHEEIKKRDPYLVLTSNERAEARIFLKSLGVLTSRLVIGINPGAAYGTAKRWLPDRFAEVADQLGERYEAEILIFGGKFEIEIAKKIQQQMKSPAVVLAGKTSLRQMMACIKTCGLFISNDSGPMHVASALNVPQVAVFGPTNPQASFSQGEYDIMVQNKVDCAPCRHRICPIDHRCMEGLSVESVFKAAAIQLNLPLQKKGAVFLDRDGTMNPDSGYIDSIQGFSLFPGTARAIKKLNQKNIPVILVTNQSGVARSLFPEIFVGELHLYLQGLLAREGAYLDGIYYCPHHPDWVACDCRKPAGGMIKKALLDFPVDYSLSYIVGDKPADILLADAFLPQAQATSILVQTGEGLKTLKTFNNSGKKPDHVSKDLPEAVDWILEQKTHENLKQS